VIRFQCLSSCHLFTN